MLRQVQLLSDKSASCFLAKTFREATRVVCSQHPLADPGVAVLGAQSVRDRRNVTTINQSRAKLRLDILAPDTTLHALVRAGYMLT